MYKGAELMGAVGALAPTVFLPPQNYTYECTSFFCPAPNLYLYLHPRYLVQFGASEHLCQNIRVEDNFAYVNESKNICID